MWLSSTAADSWKWELFLLAVVADDDDMELAVGQSFFSFLTYIICCSTYTIDINIAAEGIHVEHEAIVDEIHGEPNAEKAECYETKIFRLE